MNLTVVGLIETVRRTLLDSVLPELTTDHARGQIAGVLDVLQKMERLTEWSPAIVQSEAAPLQRLLAASSERLAAAGHASPAALAQDGDGLTHYEARTRELIDRLFSPEFAGNAPLRDELQALVSESLRESLAEQRRRIPKADFSSMTAASKS